jgi:CRP/FNR family cyclic AMP-dependent transcriptional regulator
MPSVLTSERPQATSVPSAALASTLPYLTSNDHLLIMSKAKPLTFKAGDKLIRQGSPAPAFFLIRSGKARVERNGLVLATLGEGNVFGEMTVLEGGSPASASVVADQEITVDSVSVQDMWTIFDAFPHLASRFYRSIALNLSKKLRATSNQLAEVMQDKQQ